MHTTTFEYAMLMCGNRTFSFSLCLSCVCSWREEETCEASDRNSQPQTKWSVLLQSFLFQARTVLPFLIYSGFLLSARSWSCFFSCSLIEFCSVPLHSTPLCSTVLSSLCSCRYYCTVLLSIEKKCLFPLCPLEG